MIGLRELTRVGPMLDAVGRAANPVPTPRAARSAPASRFQSEYEDEGSGLDVLAAETITEARIEQGRAVEWRHEATLLGRVVGFVAGIGLGAYLTRARRE